MPHRHRLNTILHWITLALGLITTAAAWRLSLVQSREQTRLRLSQEMDHHIAKLQERLLLGESIVHGAQGLYGASKSVERSEWMIYGAGLFDDTYFPAIRAIVSIKYVPHPQLDAFLKLTRDDECPDFTLQPPGPRSEYFPVQFVQSKNPEGQLTGRDLGLIPEVLQTLTAARDTGTFMMTSPVHLTEMDQSSSEVLLVLPLYTKGSPRSTPEERQKAIEGWVGVIMPIAELASGMSLGQYQGLEIRIFDDATTPALIYATAGGTRDEIEKQQSRPAFLERSSEVAIGNRVWRVVVRSDGDFSSGTELAFPALVLTTGCLVSLLCSRLVHSLTTTRQQARSMAAEMTHQLHTRDRQLHLALQNAHMGVWEWTPETDIFSCSEELAAICGFPPHQTPTTGKSFLQHVAPDDRDRISQSFRKAIADGELHQETYQLIRPDGQHQWINSRGRAQKETPDSPTRIVGVAMDITERRHAEIQVTELNQKLIETSRRAGMAEVATSVLHNVGNVLNSVNVSAHLALEQLKESRSTNLARAVHMLSENKQNLSHFLTEDPKGRQLTDYLPAVTDVLLQEQNTLRQELSLLLQNIEHIKHVVAMQQSHAKHSGIAENVPAEELIEAALQLCPNLQLQNRIEIVRDFQSRPLVHADRHRVLQILVNLISNAQHAMEEIPHVPRLTLSLSCDGEKKQVIIQIIDNGIGIPPENLHRIFRHGFTTRKTGHGFGLHSCANAASEMNGTLHVSSPGPGQGATFTLQLPMAKKESSRPTEILRNAA